MAPPTTVLLSTPIAQLNPELRHDESSVTGIVTLIWPYASSKQTISLLLVEPDFRLRSSRGQVRVNFHGSSAKAVARSGLRSGDQLLLSLEGAQWAKDSTAATTPGRAIDWELEYGERLVLQVRRLRERLRIATERFPSDPAPIATACTPQYRPSHPVARTFRSDLDPSPVPTRQRPLRTLNRETSARCTDMGISRFPKTEPFSRRRL